MWKPIRSPLIRYSLPFTAVLAALLLHGAVAAALPKGADFPYAFFYLIAVFAVAWYGGYVPGAIASLLTSVGLPIAVAHSFRHSDIDPVRIAIFTCISLLISKVSLGQQRARGILSDANEELDKRVKSRTEDLAQAVEGLQSEIVRRTKLEETLNKQLGRLSLLDQITRAIGERQDLKSIFQVVVRTLEDNLPIDFGCVCLYNADTETLTVSCVGLNSAVLAAELTMSEQARIIVDQNGLARCVRGHLVYEPDLSQLDFPFPKRLMQGGLGSVIAAPLRSESDIFGIIMVARREINGFSSGDCEFLRQLSEHVAVAARQAHIYTALEQAYNDLRRTQQAVMEQERLRVLGQMASGIAHDINNALSPVALYTESLLEREANLSPRTRAYLETTQRAIGDVAHTVGRMREFSRPNEPQLMLMPMDLNALVGQVLDLTRARWSDMPQQRGVVINLQTDLDPLLPPVAGIESEIREALTNLIFNAVDSMTTGGTLTLRTRATGGHRVTVRNRPGSGSGAGHRGGDGRRDAQTLFGAFLYHQGRARHGPWSGHGLWSGAAAQCSARSGERAWRGHDGESQLPRRPGPYPTGADRPAGGGHFAAEHFAGRRRSSDHPFASGHP